MRSSAAHEKPYENSPQALEDKRIWHKTSSLVFANTISKSPRPYGGNADAATVFPNPSDIGGAREKIYADFLRQHAPSKCNVFLGGFLFQDDGTESKQLDVIVTTDTAPRFDLHNPDGGGKSFSPVEGTIGVASIKSTLDKQQLFDALSGIASIPPTKSLDGRVSPILKVSNYDDWPYKIIYASNGLKGADNSPTRSRFLRRTFQYSNKQETSSNSCSR